MSTLVWVSTFSNETILRDDFVTNVRTNIAEDEADLVSDAQLYEIIYQGLRDINSRTGLLPEYCELTLDGSSYYDLPAGFTKMGSVYHINSSGQRKWIRNSNLSKVQEDYASSFFDNYIREGNRIYMYGAGASGTIRVYGSRMPTMPTTNIYIDLPNEFLQLLYDWCEWKYWRRRREMDESRSARQLYLAGIKEAQLQIAKDYGKGVFMYGKKSSKI